MSRTLAIAPAAVSWRRALVGLGVMALLGAGTIPALAKDGKDEDKRPRSIIDRLIKHRTELGLSDDQVRRLLTIQTDYQTKNRPFADEIRKARESDPPTAAAPRPDVRNMTPEQRKELREARGTQRQEWLARHPEVKPALEQIKTNRKAMRDEVKSVLTPEQQQKLKDRMEERKSRRGGRGGKGEPGGSGTGKA